MVNIEQLPAGGTNIHAVVWMTQVGPGGVTGGLQWGSATDGKRIYVADANSSATP